MVAPPEPSFTFNVVSGIVLVVYHIVVGVIGYFSITYIKNKKRRNK